MGAGRSGTPSTPGPGLKDGQRTAFFGPPARSGGVAEHVDGKAALGDAARPATVDPRVAGTVPVAAIRGTALDMRPRVPAAEPRASAC